MKSAIYYILGPDGRTPVPCPDPIEWARWFGAVGNRSVASTAVGVVRVSTVFLGLDHAFAGGPPALFETMVFGGPLDQDGERYSTWAEAEAGHERWVERAQAAA